MKCQNCGNTVNENNKFCSKCGSEVSKSHIPTSVNNSNSPCPQCGESTLSKGKKNFFSSSQRYSCSNCNYQGPLLLEESARIAWGAVAIIAIFVIISIALGEEGSIGILGIIGIARYLEDNKYRGIVSKYRMVNNLSKYKGKETNGLVRGVIYALLIIGFTFGVGYFLYGDTDSNNSYNSTSTSSGTYDTSTLISETVKELKNEMAIPQKVDDSTTLMDITAQPKAIRYHYTLSGLDVSGLSNTSIKNVLLENMCGEKDIQSLLKQNINMEYSYKDSYTNKTFFVVINRADCSL